ncbi:Uncharacterised protein [Halioglobus japonicus]|nr:Uncharacterised protein [Halioglobus japonicus]
MTGSSKKESSRVDEPTISLFEENSTSDTKKTFIIFGVGRGGTTMVAGVAKLCGLDIGKDLPINMEDNDFNIHVLRKAGIKPVHHILSSLKERNETKDIWGWKFPRVIAYLPYLRDLLVNPHLILVFRDPVATASRQILSGKPEVKAIEAVQQLQQRNMELVKNWEVPTLLVSYEKSVRHPEQFVADLCSFLNVERPAGMSDILKFMQPGRYKPI